jgi:hypothetical protein
MSQRGHLIERKHEVIREVASVRRRLEAARQSGSPQQQASIPQLEAELSQLQAEEHRLRLLIDRTQLATTIQLRPKQRTMQTQFDAFISAGYDRDKTDPLATLTGQPQKALINLADAPMIWHVARALHESGMIGEIVIVGMEPAQAPDFGRPVHYVADQGSMWANLGAAVRKLAEINSQNRYIIASNADTPLLTGDMVRWFIEACQPAEKEVYWAIVKREVMEMTFPGSKRSYLRLREGDFCSGDLFLADLQAALRAHQFTEAFFNQRKNVFQQLRLLGIGTILKFLLRRLSIQDMLGVIKRRLDLTGAPVQTPFAEVGMDVDKPDQLAQVEEYLRLHPEHPAHTRSRPLDSPIV